MNLDEGGLESEPVSPTGVYFNSSALSICILCVLEFEVPIDDSPTMTLLKDVFLPINPRFSSIMVRDENGAKQWKKVEVKLQDHVKIPVFPSGLSPESYDKYFTDYLSRIAMEQLPQNRPLWEIHIIKYPTSHAAGNVVFKLHHALGDGYSLMGALLSCLQRADDPSCALTFPSLGAVTSSVPKMNIINSAFNTLSDFVWTLLKSCWFEDDRSRIRSGNVAVEFKPMVISTITFSLNQIKQIKTMLGVTINDVITGIIFFGTRLYMLEMSNKMSNEDSTALVLFNTRNIGGYKSVKEMIKPDPNHQWGNQFGFLHISIPDLTSSEHADPLEFVLKTQKSITRKRSSGVVHLTAQLLEAVKKFRGPEAAARFIHSTLRNSSMTISNVVGPVEAMTLANHPVKGLYFLTLGSPQSLTISVLSYTGKLRVAVGTEKGFIDEEKFRVSIENAFDMIFKAALRIDQQVKTEDHNRSIGKNM
ncbi:hypothetical protein SLE2022_234510 [Rubroshorea leprosula]